MRRTPLIGGVAALLLASACSDATRSQPSNNWSGAVIKVAANDPTANGELRGIVIDSSTGLDPSTATPIPGATVVLRLKVTIQPTSPHDTAYTTVEEVGQVVTDAHGRFLVTSIAPGEYSLVASPPANLPFYSNSTWAFVSSGSSTADAVIYLPREIVTSPDSTLPPPTGHPIDDPMNSPGDST